WVNSGALNYSKRLYLLAGVVATPPSSHGVVALLPSTSTPELITLHRRFAHLLERALRTLAQSGHVTLASHPLELVHSDVLTVDTASLAASEPLDRKFSVFEAFKRFKATDETESGPKLQHFRSDNGGPGTRLDARAIPLVFVGYEGDMKAYHLLQRDALDGQTTC
ncbi:hypothetical protein JCM1840_000134, partial [Sporobolomyces johnsonii]